MRYCINLFWISCISIQVHAQTPFASLQIPELESLPDRTEELQRLIDKSAGNLSLKAGVYRISDSLRFALQQKQSTVIRASDGPVTLIMDGPGAAIEITGSHEGTASPKSFDYPTWNERMPIIEGIEIIGNHPEADGISLVRCVQPSITRVAIRWCRHGIHLTDRNRNVIVSDCHLYENSGAGLYLDDVNLHQINVGNSHISYNRAGGIVVRDGNVRNLHITGCDLEGNMPADDSPTGAANILLDVSGYPDDKTRSIAEVAITGCTIQHSSNYGGKSYEALAPGGANIRIIGKEIWPIDSVTITGNVISDTSVLIDINTATDIAINGNTFFAPNPDFFHATNCKRLNLNGNSFNPRQFRRPGRLVFEGCEASIISNCTFHALEEERGAIRLNRCQDMILSNNILSQCKSGLLIEKSRNITVKNWSVSGIPESELFRQDSESIVNR
ncbi:MAG: ATP-binding protein [Verrucomicrobiales bacterium]|nr:ATP-binding protein [Verrucomicrobiales bacterium]|tara:strand:- start:42896 stop:44230 length:1335 start_codon:yes stop_codon:yes gene_type:complete